MTATPDTSIDACIRPDDLRATIACLRERGVLMLAGHHSRVDEERGGCAMDILAFVTGTPGTDFPPCTSRSIARVVQRLNDWMTPVERSAHLWDLLPELAGTNTGPDDERTRAYLAADWAIRTILPRLARRLNAKSLALDFEAIPPLVDATSGRIAGAQTLKLRPGLRKAASTGAAVYASYLSASAFYRAADAVVDASLQTIQGAIDDGVYDSSVSVSASAVGGARSESITLRLELIRRLCAVGRSPSATGQA